MVKTAYLLCLAVIHGTFGFSLQSAYRTSKNFERAFFRVRIKRSGFPLVMHLRTERLFYRSVLRTRALSFFGATSHECDKKDLCCVYIFRLCHVTEKIRLGLIFNHFYPHVAPTIRHVTKSPCISAGRS